MVTYLRELLIIVAVLVTTQALSKETRKVVAIVDTGIANDIRIKKYLCDGLHVDFTGTSLYDQHGHGTNIAGIIATKMNPKTHCIAILKYWHTAIKPEGNRPQYEIIKSVSRYLKTLKPAYINFSSAGGSFDPNEFNVLGDLLDAGTKVVVAAGNSGKDLTETPCNNFPACYYFDSPNFYVVGHKGKTSNFNGPVKYFRPGINQCGLDICMSGTSQSTANMTAYLLSKENK